MKIEVTEKDIKKGKKVDSVECPVSRAIRRRLGYAYEVGTYAFDHKQFRVCLKRKGKSRVDLCSLPPKVSHFISSYDKGQEVSPIYFYVPWEETSLESPTIHE